jgi:predicted amidohydrolase YtcJ
VARLTNLPRLLPALTLALLATACGGGSYIDNEVSAGDFVFRNGYVYTQNAAETVAQAVVVTRGRIVFVGTDSGAQGFIGSQTRVIDLGGRMLMPGLVDGHLHALEGGAQALSCNLNYASLTVAQFRTMIQACLDATKDKGPDVWLKVVNWDRQAMNAVDRDPTRADLDSLQTTRPILVRSIDFHTRLSNTRAITLAGITRTTPAPGRGQKSHHPDRGAIVKKHE